MIKDKLIESVVAALKHALAEPAEQRLYRSGKLPGIFPTRLGINGEAAAHALREGLLEIVRTETKGKATTEWVRATPRAVDFVHEHESPIRALKDLRTALQVSRDAVPDWLSAMHGDLSSVATRLTQEAQRWSQRLELMSKQVEDAIRRVEIGENQVSNGTAGATAWIQQALVYLDRRRDGGVAGPCPLPELFAAMRQHSVDLSLKAFHEGIRRLHDRRALRLVPFTGPPHELPEPEFALLEGGDLLYFAAR
jgi:hypothetical protein